MLRTRELAKGIDIKSLRILVADDHDVVRVGLRALLESQKGWTICGEAATGREAVESAMQHQPDVAILDFSMPELNGLDATLQIRKSLPDTKVLIITMHDSEHLAREAHRAGAHGFLVKTDARRHLVMAVRALSEHKTFFVDAAPTVLLEQRRDTQSQSADSMGMENRLTPREREILQLVALGKPSKEIANVLGIRTKTVEAHRANIMNKLDLHSVSGLVRYAIREKMVEA